MDVEKSSKTEAQMIAQCVKTLHEKDRLSYSGKFVQGFVHNANGPLQNLTMLTEMLGTGIEVQDRLFRSNSGEDGKWSEVMAKQQKRLAQMREQINNLAGDLREFMQLYEIERYGTEIDINILVSRMAKVFRSDLFFKHQVKSELRLAKNLPHIKALGRDMVPAVFHLFHNAVVALKGSSVKELSVETSMQDGCLILNIIDSGCGFGDLDNTDVLFELFESRWKDSEDDTSSRDLHLGFGLYAARQLLLPYGFTVTLEKRTPGTSAVIRMPLETKPA
jgi:signal transduction histidine kinase